MTINKQYISTKNTNSAPNKPKYIVIHETDNFSVGANASRHAYAQYNGHLSTSVHFYCGDDGIYQVADYTSSCWSIGKTYLDKRPIMDATNYNVISIEICVNADGNYTIARDNAIALTKFLMGDLGITVDRVIRHYDAKGKYCPRKMMDNPSLWVDFKNQIGSKVEPTPSPIQPTPISEYYRVGKDWQNGICVGQIGAFKVLDNAKRVCSVGYNVYDEKGSIVYTSTPTPAPQPQPIPQPSGYVVGNVYTVRVDGLRVREGAGTNYGIKSRNGLTVDGRKNADGNGRLLKGTAVTCLAVSFDGSGNTWIKIPSGWISAKYNGEVYVG